MYFCRYKVDKEPTHACIYTFNNVQDDAILHSSIDVYPLFLDKGKNMIVVAEILNATFVLVIQNGTTDYCRRARFVTFD